MDDARFAVRDVDSINELAQLLVKERWFPRTAYRCRGYLFFAGSPAEDGSYDLSVVRERDLARRDTVWVNPNSVNELRFALWAIFEADLGFDGAVAQQIELLDGTDSP